MYIKEEINIDKMIVHILDTNVSRPVTSMDEIPHSYEIKDFFIDHIIKVMNNDSIKNCIFNEEDNMFYSYLQDYSEDNSFLEFTHQITEWLFTIMSANIDIPSCDLAFIKFGCRNQKYIAMLKMNYLDTYIHFTDYDSDINVNTIIKHTTTLPSPSQIIKEAIIINLNTLDINILERKYQIDGVKEFYLSKYLLKCDTKLSSKEQYNIVKKAADIISKKYFDEDVEKKMEITQELYNSIEETGEIDLKKFANDVFDSSTSLKDEFLETLEKKGLDEPVIQLTEKTINRSLDRQKIKTDTGVEIKMPMEIYNDLNSIEFVTNPNGKISIVLKNINKII